MTTQLSIEQVIARIKSTIDAGVLQSTWIAPAQVMVDRSTWPPELLSLEKQWAPGLRSHEVPSLPLVLQCMADRLPLSGPRSFHISRFRVNGTAWVTDLDVSNVLAWKQKLDLLGTQALVFVQDGLWVIERGPHHPGVVAFNGLSAWVEAVNGKPFPLTWGGVDGRGDSPALELHPSEGAVAALIAQLKRVDEDYEAHPLELRGSALLSALQEVDTLLWNQGTIDDIRYVPVASLAVLLQGWDEVATVA